jgi:signal transduction histidine kinase
MPKTGPSNALLLTPSGRDAPLAASLLKETGIASTICADLAGVVDKLNDDVSFVVIAEEAARNTDGHEFAKWIENQPSWSDLPIVLIVRHGGGPERNPAANRYIDVFGNVIFVERPFHPMTFVSVARTALRSRRRQYDARGRLEQLHDREAELRTLNEGLESRVVERTHELELAHAAVLKQVAERERAEKSLRQAQKMETIGQLTGGVAHDFNNLLMAVLGNLDLLRKHATDARSQRLIDGAIQGARRGASLTQRLLAYSRQQDLDIKPVDLASLITGMEELLRRSLGPSITLRLSLQSNLAPAKADANQTEMALLNLVINSRDAMPDGGMLSVDLSERRMPSGEPGDYLVISVSDSGTGMDETTLARAIEPFYSTKEVGKGTGLGLSMVHGLAVQLKGALRLESKLGQGTVAELWLPVASESGAAVREHTSSLASDIAPATAQNAPSVQREARILFVDDDALIAMSTVDMLEDLGHAVVEASSGAEALKIIKDDGTIDLLITDHAMPRMTGSELAKAVRLLRPRLPILLATGYANLPEGDDLNLPRLAKPYDQAQLACEIQKLLGVA